MGADFLCFVCGGPEFDTIYSEDAKYKNTYDSVYLKKIHNHLNSLVFLTLDNEVITECSGSDGSYTSKNNESKLTTYHYFLGSRNYLSKHGNTLHTEGIFCHTGCYAFISKEYGINLTYSKLPQLEFDNYSAMMKPVITNNPSPYKKISKYWGQYFDQDHKVISNKDLYLVDIDDSVTQKEIKANLKNFGVNDIKLDTESPQLSAKYYENGIIKIGQNKRFWINNNEKWKMLNDELKIIQKIIKNKTLNSKAKKIKVDKLKKFINSIPSVTECNTKCLFIIDVKFDNGNNQIIMTFVCSSKEEIILNEKFNV